MERIGVYPGSFDPVTNGHLDIIKRAAKMVDKLVVTVLINSSKNNLFTIEERMNMIKEAVKDMDNVSVDTFSGLLIDYCKENNIKSIIRGLRAISDFEYELQMAQMNRNLSIEIETLFLITSTKYSFLSSSIVKEVARYDGCIANFVPEHVRQKLREKMRVG